MADTVQRVEYFYVQVPNRPGEGARYLTALRDAGLNLLAFSGFPEGRGAQLDFVPADPAAFRGFAKRSCCVRYQRCSIGPTCSTVFTGRFVTPVFVALRRLRA